MVLTSDGRTEDGMGQCLFPRKPSGAVISNPSPRDLAWLMLLHLQAAKNQSTPEHSSTDGVHSVGQA